MLQLQEKIKKVNMFLEFLRNFEIKLSENQVKLEASSRDAENFIMKAFSIVKKAVIEELDKRELVLLDVVQQYYDSETTSNKNIAQNVIKNFEILEKLVNLQEDGDKFDKTFNKYIEEVKHDCLNLSVHQSVQIDAHLEDQDKLLESCKTFGRVSTGSPVRVTKIIPYPGALLIHWDVMGEDYNIEEFRLQKKQLKSPSFNSNQKHEDCYRGLQKKYLDKKILQNENYVYRVCLKYENPPKWSEWSLLRLAPIALRSLCWKNNSNFKLTCDNVMAESLAEKPVSLFSANFKFYPGFYVEIMFLKCKEKRDNVFIGLSATEEYVEDVMALPKALFIEANGNIFSDELKKTTKLPPIRQDKKVVFTCEKFEDKKMRVHIDNHNMRVTYDWILEKPEMFIFFNCNSPNWKITIH